MTLPIRITSMVAMPPFFEKKHKEQIAAHLKKLSLEDRYLRFCNALKDEAIDEYVNKIDFDVDAAIVIYDVTSNEEVFQRPIIGFLHIGPLDTKGECEFGISVNAEFRNTGIASSLFEHGLIYSKAHGYQTIYMNCLYENMAMRHIAKKNGLDTTSDFNEVTAKLKVDISHQIENAFLEATNNNIAIFDLAYRAKVHQVREWLKLFSFNPT